LGKYCIRAYLCRVGSAAGIGRCSTVPAESPREAARRAAGGKDAGALTARRISVSPYQPKSDGAAAQTITHIARPRLTLHSCIPPVLLYSGRVRLGGECMKWKEIYATAVQAIGVVVYLGGVLVGDRLSAPAAGACLFLLAYIYKVDWRLRQRLTTLEQRLAAPGTD
jgi:hypothetical protein